MERWPMGAEPLAPGHSWCWGVKFETTYPTEARRAPFFVSNSLAFSSGESCWIGGSLVEREHQNRPHSRRTQGLLQVSVEIVPRGACRVHGARSSENAFPPHKGKSRAYWLVHRNLWYFPCAHHKRRFVSREACHLMKCLFQPIHPSLSSTWSKSSICPQHVTSTYKLRHTGKRT